MYMKILSENTMVQKGHVPSTFIFLFFLFFLRGQARES